MKYVSHIHTFFRNFTNFVKVNTPEINLNALIAKRERWLNFSLNRQPGELVWAD